MIKIGKTLALAVGMLTIAACTRHDIVYYSVTESLNTAEAKEVIDPRIALYFGQDYIGDAKILYEYAQTNRKTNAWGKSDFKTCTWAFLSGIVSLQNRAKTLGATKVTNIVTNYPGSAYSVPGMYECHVGQSISRVSLVGDIRE